MSCRQSNTDKENLYIVGNQRGVNKNRLAVALVISIIMIGAHL